jgi:two-component system KDP operon response regulator KdpE
MAGFHVLVIDDEPEIRKLLQTTLENGDYRVTAVASGREGLKLISAKPPDILILDLGLPDMDGQAVLIELRQWSKLPVIVLSAREHEEDKVKALDNGADDYLTKPFGTAELFARLKVALRHAGRQVGGGSVYHYQQLKVDLEKRLVTLADEIIHLTPTEYKLLAALAKEPGRVVTQSQLINAVWGKNSQGNSHYLRIYIQHLRNKLKDNPLNPTYILTDSGVGYRLVEG